MRLLTMLLFTVSLLGQMTPFTVGGNFPRDLMGPVDTRPNTWGNADYAVLPIKFKPPMGYRVQILRLRGDITAWPKLLGLEPAVPDNQYAGVLLGFSTTSSNGSVECDWCADGCFVYIQGAIHGGQAIRAPFNYNLRHDSAYLDADNILNLKIAAYLNTTGVPIHIEGTYNITAQYVRAPIRIK